MTTTQMEKMQQTGSTLTYQFETINPKSTVVVTKKSTPQKRGATVSGKKKPSSFAFEGRFSKKIPNVRLDVAVDYLRPSPFAKRALKELGIDTVRQLIEVIENSDTSMRLGQGIIEEFREKVTKHLGSPWSFKAEYIDLLALLRVVFHNFAPKERYITLKQYQLEEVFALGPNEKHTTNKYTQKEQAATIEHTLAVCKEKHAEYITNVFRTFHRHLTFFWLHERHGFCQEKALVSWLYEKTFKEQTITEPFFQKLIVLFRDIVAPCSLWEGLVAIAPKLWAADTAVKNEVACIVEKAKNFLYHTFSSYPLNTLITCMKKELLREWISFDEHFIKKVLITHPDFVLFRDEKRELYIQYNSSFV